MNTPTRKHSEAGSTFVVAMFTTLILGGFVAVAVEYTSNIGRNAQRDRVFNNAVEIGDGCLEMAFGSWRELSKGTENPPTSSFSAIPTPSPGNFPTFPNATISNFLVQAVDPLITLASDNPPISALPSTSPPSKTTGPGTGTFSYFYLATADVTLPFTGGNLTAKVRRIFEKRYTSAWNWAMLYNDDLELHPNSQLTLNGWVHSNKDIYAGNGVASADPAATPPPANLTLLDRLTYAGNYNVGFSPLDPYHTNQTNMAGPTTPADLPPGREQTYSPFGWDASSFGTTADTNGGYREMIEKPTVPWASTATTDPFKDTRLYNEAGVVIEISSSGNAGKPNQMTVYAQSAISGGRSNALTNQPSGGSPNREAWDIAAAVLGADTSGKFVSTSFQDNREGKVVNIVDVNVSQLSSVIPSSPQAWNGVLYITDTRSGTSPRAVRLKNGATVPSGGLTIVSDNPVYIQGDFNSGRTSTTEPPSNTGNPDDPDAGSYKRAPAAIMADAITLLSNNWSDTIASLDMSLPAKIATNTTVNAALVAGNVPSDGTNYSGGGENFVRFLENWTGHSFTYYGSMLGLYASKQALGKWGLTDYYRPPQQNWYFDPTLTVDSSGNAVAVPGYVSTVSYLQQQRWYLQF